MSFGKMIDEEVSQAGLKIVGEYTSNPPALSEITDLIGEILYGPRKQWGCYKDGLITGEELVNMLAGHLINLATNFELPSKLNPPSEGALSQLFVALFAPSPNENVMFRDAR